MAEETWVGAPDGSRKRIEGWWIGDATGARREIEKVWMGDPAGAPKLVYTNKPTMTTKLTATAVSHTQIDLSWTPTSGEDITYFIEGTSGLKTNKGTALSHSDTNLRASTKYNYRVDVLWKGQYYAEAHASATTQAAPVPNTSSGSVNGPALSSSGGWTQSTPQDLKGPLFNISGYVSSFTLYVGGYGTTGSYDPYIGGARLGWRSVPSGTAWRTVDGKSTQVSGSTRFGAHAGGSGRPATAWQTYAGAAWNYNVAVGVVNYWWYTRAADGRSTQADEPWWIPALDGVDIHVESWVDEFGNITRAVITGKESGEVLHEWEA